MNDNLFNQLNKQQKEAVKYTEGPSIILAGAGSGKTRVLVHKVLNLIMNHAISPNSIVMITFTNKAAGEMKKRMNLIKLGFIGTYHSFCCQILRREAGSIGLSHNFVIYDEDDQFSLLKKIIKNKEIQKFTPSFFLKRISTAKNQMIYPDRYLELFADYSASMVSEIYDNYQKELRKNNALDFDDLILETVNLFLKNDQILDKYQDKYRFILVDEYQDTNYIQYLLTKLLGEKYRNITVVGDFSQSIYSWRGADIRNLEKFRDDFKETMIFNLEENYRSTQKILNFANQVISKNQTHPILDLFTNKKSGDDIIFFEAENEQQEAIYVADRISNFLAEGKNKVYQYSSFAVLYRTNAQSRIIEEAFLHYGLPYMLIGGTRFYERKEIKDVLSYLRLFINPNDDVAKTRIMKLGKRRWEIFKKFYIKIKDKAVKLSTVELIEELFNNTHYLDIYDTNDEEDYARVENIKELKSVAINFPKLQEFLEQVALVESEYFEGEKINRQEKFTQEKDKDNRIRLMTLHQAKGLEFPVVFIVGVEEGILPHARSIDDIFSLEEERRLFYVGITRAKDKLHITYTRGRTIFGRKGESIKSRFIEQENEGDYSLN